MSDPGQTAAPPPFTWEAPPGTPGAPIMPAGGQVMGSGQIFDRAAWIYRRGFLILLAVAAVVQIPVAVIAALIGGRYQSAFESLRQLNGQSSPEQVSAAFQNAGPAISAGITVGLISFIGGLLLSPALIATIARVHRGEPVSLGDAYSSAFQSVLSILGGSIISGLAIFGLIVAFVVAGIVVAVVGNDAGIGWVGWVIAFVGAIVAAVYVGIRWTVWSQAVVLERRGPFEALARSWGLVRGSMWRILGIVVVTGILVLIAGIALGIIGGIVGLALPISWRGVPAAILGVLTASWVPIVTTLLYFDLRARREGPAMGAAAPPPPIAMPAPMTPPEPMTPSEPMSPPEPTSPPEPMSSPE